MSSRFLVVIIVILLTITSLNNITVNCVPNTTVVDVDCGTERYTDGPYGSLVRDLLSDLSINTASQPRYQYYVGYTDEGETTAAYGFASCSTTLSAVDCMNCLGIAAQFLLELCPSAVGPWVQLTDCFMRYANFPFYGTN